ncbi:MAG: hypothetical protein K0S04_4292 [Herbinix sp.]|jgi:hypothetical protein|nr:hypothetical protein [Herbinix sp.]
MGAKKGRAAYKEAALQKDHIIINIIYYSAMSAYMNIQ